MRPPKTGFPGHREPRISEMGPVGLPPLAAEGGGGVDMNEVEA
jgi:hypothetical protein